MSGTLPSTSVIVWEYGCDVPGLYAPYSDKVSNYIENKYAQDNTAEIILGNADATLNHYTIELANMVQVNPNHGSQRQIRRKLYDATMSTIGRGIVWEWLTDKGWITYDVETLCAIEDSYSKSEEKLDLEQLHCHLPNIILIKKGYQKNKYSNFVRPVQRRSASYTYSTTSSPTSSQNISQRVSGSTNTSSASLNVGTSSSQGTSATNKNRTRRNSGSKRNQNKRSHSNDASGPSQSSSPSSSPSTPSAGARTRPSKPKSVIMAFCYLARKSKIPDDENCAICLVPLADEDDQMKDPIVQLKRCKHMYHTSCMEAYYKQGPQNGCMQCPICKTIHGTKTGNQPPGKMDVRFEMNRSVAGYEGDGMIIITYTIHNGIQGPNHPSPNTPYMAVSFPRQGYLPANDKGKKVLTLLQVAWQRKLIFTIGTSTTTGIEHSVIWNEIHHKTSPVDNGSGHGFPDPTYLDNVLDELKQHGIEDISP